MTCGGMGWAMGSGMMDGWHDRMHYRPRDGRDQNRRRRTSDDAGGYDNDWRDGGSGYDDGTATDDYSNP